MPHNPYCCSTRMHRIHRNITMAFLGSSNLKSDLLQINGQPNPEVPGYCCTPWQPGSRWSLLGRRRCPIALFMLPGLRWVLDQVVVQSSPIPFPPPKWCCCIVGRPVHSHWGQALTNGTTPYEQWNVRDVLYGIFMAHLAVGNTPLEIWVSGLGPKPS